MIYCERRLKWVKSVCNTQKIPGVLLCSNINLFCAPLINSKLKFAFLVKSIVNFSVLFCVYLCMLLKAAKKGEI